jgi:hypothetical protein
MAITTTQKVMTKAYVEVAAAVAGVTELQVEPFNGPGTLRVEFVASAAEPAVTVLGPRLSDGETMTAAQIVTDLGATGKVWARQISGASTATVLIAVTS